MEIELENKIPKIAGAGIACIDYIVQSPKVAWGDTAIVSSYYQQGGGLIATALVACARLGADCDFFTLLGNDLAAEQILQELRDEKVCIDGAILIEDGKSPLSFIHVDKQSGERTIFHRPGIGLLFETQSINLSSISHSDALLIDNIYPELSIQAAQTAHNAGVPVVADIIPDKQNSELLKWVDILIAPNHFARDMGCEDDPTLALETMHSYGPKTAVITQGSKGWIYSDSKEKRKGRAFQVKTVDTTGAGDSFHGAFAFAIACGWNTQNCCEFASAVAAINCISPGGRTGLPSLNQTLEFLRERSRLNW